MAVSAAAVRMSPRKIAVACSSTLHSSRYRLEVRPPSTARPGMTRVVVLDANAEEVGALVCWRKKRGEDLFISSLSVQPPHRRRGLATALLDAAEQLPHGCVAAELTVLRWNQPAIAMYARGGYSVTPIGALTLRERFAAVASNPLAFITQIRMRKTLV